MVISLGKHNETQYETYYDSISHPDRHINSWGMSFLHGESPHLGNPSGHSIALGLCITQVDVDQT